MPKQKQSTLFFWSKDKDFRTPFSSTYIVNNALQQRGQPAFQPFPFTTLTFFFSSNALDTRVCCLGSGMAIGKNDLAKGPRSETGKKILKRMDGASCLAKHSRHLKNRFWPFSPFLFHFLISSFYSPFTSIPRYFFYFDCTLIVILYIVDTIFILLRINGCNVQFFYSFFFFFEEWKQAKHVVKVRRTGTSFSRYSFAVVNLFFMNQ